LVNSEHLDNEEKIIKIFKNIQNVITTKVELKKVYGTLLDYDKKWVVMKSLVVISQKDFDYLSSKILSSQSHSQEPENQKSLKDHFIEELSSCTGVSRKFIKNSIKPRANDSVLMMISDYIDAAEKKQPPEEDEVSLLSK